MLDFNSVEDVRGGYSDSGEECAIARILERKDIQFNDFPFEIRSQILDGFLPPRDSVLKTTRRSHQQTCLQFPVESKRTLVPLLLVSKSISADLVTLILGRCTVSINHDSSRNSLVLLEESRFLNLPVDRFGLTRLRRMEVIWAPETEWDTESFDKFCKLFTKTTGLVELKITIPTTWWNMEEVWKRSLRTILANAPNLSAIQLGRYYAITNCHPGWQIMNKSQQHIYRNGDWQLLEMDDA